MVPTVEDGLCKKLRRGPRLRSVYCAVLTSLFSVMITPVPAGSEDLKYTTNGVDYEPLKDPIEDSLLSIHAVSTGALGSLCVTRHYRRLEAAVNSSRWETLRVRADLAAAVLQELGMEKQDVLEAVSRGLVSGDSGAASARAIALSAVAGGDVAGAGAAWDRRGGAGVGPPARAPPPPSGDKINSEYPWYEEATLDGALRSPKFMQSSFSSSSAAGWWTYPYYSCQAARWLVSYTVPITTTKGFKGILSLDVDINGLEVNQCESSFSKNKANQISSFHGTHKCHNETTHCEYKRVKGVGVNARNGWARGAYVCKCRRGYYSTSNPEGFNGSLVEIAYQERETSSVDNWSFAFACKKCQPGCDACRGPEPCLAHYNWPFRISLLAISVWCASLTVALAAYTRRHRRAKVFRVASPVFLSITLLGCAIMYLEMAAIFPVLDMYSCIATKWTRHMGFCITYTALLMKTWRVSLTYRVKSAHKLKLTDKQLLQWMAPVLLVMLVYLGTWTISASPYAEVIEDSRGLKFKQCSYNWWDHSMAIGEVFFLLWGIRVCYSVRHAESLYNEARLISYAIYNIAAVNMVMVAFHLMIVPQAGPDIKYGLGFIRTQLSTSVTIMLVFGPKVLRVMRGAGDTWDRKARAALPASLSLNGVGLVPDEPPDLYTENEELKEEIQKLAAQIEFMKIVHMELHNRHLKPRPGGYFSTPPALPAVQPCPMVPSPNHRGHALQGCGEV